MGMEDKIEFSECSVKRNMKEGKKEEAMKRVQEGGTFLSKGREEREGERQSMVHLKREKKKISMTEISMCVCSFLRCSPTALSVSVPNAHIYL